MYTLRSPASSLAQVRSEDGVASLVYTHLLFAPDLVQAAKAKYEGDAQIEGQKVAVYRSEPPQPGSAQYALYLDKASGLPRRISLFEKDGDGYTVETTRTDFSDWQINPDLPNSLFDPTPPADFHLSEPEKPAHDARWKAGMMPAPLQASTLAGKPLSLDTYKGRVVLLDYWASWCGSCLSEMPDTLALYLPWHKRGLEVVGISLDYPPQREKMLAYLKQKLLPWPQVCDYKGFSSPFATAYQVNAMPFNLLIGRDGKIAAVNLHGKELKQAVQKALNTKN